MTTGGAVEVGDELRIDHRGHADTDGVRRPGGQALRFGAHRVQAGNGLSDQWEHAFPERGGCRPAGRPIEQSITELPFQAGDPAGQRGLGHSVGAGGGPERADVGHRAGVPEPLAAQFIGHVARRVISELYGRSANRSVPSRSAIRPGPAPPRIWLPATTLGMRR